MELFLFYKFSFLVAFTSASSLSIVGHHQLIRGKVIEVFALSQFALIGNLLSRLIFHSSESSTISLIASYASFFIGKAIIANIKIASNIYGSSMVGIYLFILALQYLLIGLFPQLDSHMSIGLFGNMATSTYVENFILIIIFSISLIFFLKYSKNLSKRSLENSIFKNKKSYLSDLLLFSIPLVSSLYSLGFLYTLSFLLIPNLILGTSFKNQKTATLVVLIVASLASVVGLFLSIAFENVSTTPAQIINLVFACLVLKLLLRIIENRKRP